jgi:lambda repressor-like predicted transcriptional regulator
MLAMPKQNQTPPIDWLWAAVLERKMRFGIDLKELAKIAGVGYETMRRLITQSPWEWGEDARTKVCKALGIKPIQTVQFAPPDDWGLTR